MKRKKLIAIFDKVMEGMLEGTILTPYGDKYRKSTVTNNYKRCREELAAFEKIRGTIYLEEVNVRFGEAFRAYLLSQNMAKNTIANRLASLKAVVRRMYMDGKTTFSGTGIIASGEITTAIYNTVHELKVMADFDLIASPSLERIRDVYIIHCFVGLRIGDLKALLFSPKQFIRYEHKKWFIEIKTQKTGEVVTIPIATAVKRLLVKRNYDFGKSFTYQYYNYSLKKLGEKLGLENEIVTSITKGGVRKDEVKKKFELMSSHTARRSFATNAYLAQVPTMAIMKVTGHKTQLSFIRYIRCAAMESALGIADHPFFKES